MNKEVFLDNIDEELLNKQRSTFKKVILPVRHRTSEAIEHLEGLESLLDEISDQLYYQNEKD